VIINIDFPSCGFDAVAKLHHGTLMPTCGFRRSHGTGKSLSFVKTSSFIHYTLPVLTGAQARKSFAIYCIADLRPADGDTRRTSVCFFALFNLFGSGFPAACSVEVDFVDERIHP
jgi:hypothetical protein